MKVKNANVRWGPGRKHEITWVVEKFMPFNKITKRGNWIRVGDFERDYHWIHKNLVTSKYQCAVIKKAKLNLRQGPGTNYKILNEGILYETFKVIKIRGNWAKIQDARNNTYWAWRPYLWIN